MVELSIAKDFSKTPAGRTRKAHGKHSGETFRENVLEPRLRKAINANSKLRVILDGTAGYPASFLDEAFGGLVRKGSFSKREMKESLIVEAHHPAFHVYRKLVDQYIEEAQPLQQSN